MIHIIITITITKQCIWKLYGFFEIDNNNNSINVPLSDDGMDMQMQDRPQETRER